MFLPGRGSRPVCISLSRKLLCKRYKPSGWPPRSLGRPSYILTGLLCDTLAAAPLGQSLPIVWVPPCGKIVSTRKVVTIAMATVCLSNILTRLVCDTFAAALLWPSPSLVSPRPTACGKPIARMAVGVASETGGGVGTRLTARTGRRTTCENCSAWANLAGRSEGANQEPCCRAVWNPVRPRFTA